MKYPAFSFMFSIVAFFAQTQTMQTFSLPEIIQLAKSQSPRYKLAQTQKEISYYEYLTYKSDFKPQVSLYGNAPVYGKQYTSVTQPDGTIQFLPIQQNLNNIGFSLSQQIPFTGGQLSLNTELNQFYDFQSKYNQFNGTPVFLRLNQPLFGFNALKWQKKIEPLKLEESKREYVHEMENIAQQATELYFNVLDAQSNKVIAETNLINTTTNLNIEEKRINLGTTTEDKILQLSLQSLKSRQGLEKAKYDLGVAILALTTFIGVKDITSVDLLIPELIPEVEVALEKAIEYTKKYRPEYIAFERKKLEAAREVAQAKAAKQEVNLTASYGLNRAGEHLGVIYSDPKDQQTFAIGFNVPILDWGRRKARYNTAKAIERLTTFTNDLDDATIVQEVTTLVSNIELLKSNIGLAKITDSVAARRYTIANNLYQSGKLSITELNLAQAEKDEARRSFISALRDFWNAYYQLRKLTMFDFVKQESLYKAE
ncbi:MAG: TolC family protein [Chitinophagaceae bacterium]|nr:TolC family protein [Chitinophagaceae bacterium]